MLSQPHVHLIQNRGKHYNHNIATPSRSQQQGGQRQKETNIYTDNKATQEKQIQVSIADEEGDDEDDGEECDVATLPPFALKETSGESSDEEGDLDGEEEGEVEPEAEAEAEAGEDEEEGDMDDDDTTSLASSGSGLSARIHPLNHLRVSTPTPSLTPSPTPLSAANATSDIDARGLSTTSRRSSIAYSEDGEDTLVSAGDGVSRTSLLVAVLRLSDGRDKCIKLLFYASHLTRWVARTILSRLAASRLLSALSRRVSGSAVLSLLSLSALRVDHSADQLIEVLGSTRQLLRLGRWIFGIQIWKETYQAWRDTRAVKDASSSVGDPSPILFLLELLNASLGLLIDFLDDLEWICEQEVLSEALGRFAGKMSAALWLFTVCIDIPLTITAIRDLASGQKGEEATVIPVTFESLRDPSFLELIFPSLSDLFSSSCVRAETLSLLRYVGDLSVSSSLLLGHCSPITHCGGVLAAAVSLYKLLHSQSLHNSVH